MSDHPYKKDGGFPPHPYKKGGPPLQDIAVDEGLILPKSVQLYRSFTDPASGEYTDQLYQQTVKYASTAINDLIQELKDLRKIVAPYLAELRIQNCGNCWKCRAEPDLVAHFCWAHKDQGKILMVKENKLCIYTPSEWVPWPRSAHETLLRLESRH